MATNIEKVLELSAIQEMRGLPENPEGVGQVTEPSCGDLLTIGFTTRREIITEIGYTLTESACPPVFASAYHIVSQAKGQAVMAAYLISWKDIAAALSDNGELNPEHIHCAMMAELALKNAIVNYSQKKKEKLTER